MKKNWISRLCSFHWDFGFDFFKNDVKNIKSTIDTGEKAIRVKHNQEIRLVHHVEDIRNQKKYGYQKLV